MGLWRRNNSASHLLAPSQRLATSSTRLVRASVVLLMTTGLGLACGDDGSEPNRITTSGVTCGDDTVACGDTCADLESSARHCGDCDTLCPNGAICDLGVCRPASAGCSASLALCGSDCVEVTDSHDHCGTCDTACPADAECVTGACVCPDQLAACGDVCTDTLTDRENCGACGQGCVDAQTCENGSCVCPAGTELCSSQGLVAVDDTVALGTTAASCVDTQVDARHCGACGNACNVDQVCTNGNCECPAGQVACGERCADLDSDADNCGACGNACGDDHVCSNGNCACPEGQTECNGSCVDVQTNADNCGQCGNACSLGQGCADGSCQAGALGDDDCQGLAGDLTISEVAAYQTVKVDLARDGQPVTSPTSLVARRPTLVRVFVTPAATWVQRQVSARLFLQDGDAVATQYSEAKLDIAAASSDDDRASTFEFKVTSERITPTTRFAVEVVECGTGSGTLQSPRFPAAGAEDLAAVDTGGLRVRLIPMRSNGQLPDTSDEALQLYEAAFLDTYPIASVELTVGDPLDVADPEDWNGNLNALRLLRQQQQPPRDVYYYGMLKPTDTLQEFCGRGCVAGVGYVGNPRQNGQQRASMGLAYGDVQSAFTMLHEVGHNHGRNHAPCAPGGQIAGVDPNFPQPNGAVGVYGYDALGDQLLPPDFTDLMGYCQNQWLSDYTYNGLLQATLTVNQVQASVFTDPQRLAPWRVLLVDRTRGARWGASLGEVVEASGDAERALVFDAAGSVLEEVDVYRTSIGDIDAASIEVPEPKPGWHSIQVAGAPPIVFAAQP